MTDEMFALAKSRAAAGEPIYYFGPLDGPEFEQHVGLLKRLQGEVDRPLRVVYDRDD